MPALRDWAATDLIHGWWFLATAGIIAALAAAAPIRAEGRHPAFVHGVVVGCTVALLVFFLTQADLFARDDRLAGMLVLITVVAAITRITVGPYCLYRICRRELAHDPSATRLLAVSRAVINGTELEQPAGSRSRGAKLFNLYVEGRSRVGLGPSRSYAVEWAL